MKKTLLLKLLTLVFTLCSVLFIATGCNFECTEHKEKWIIDKEATCTSQGIMHAECELCGRYMGAEIIEQSGHNYVNHVCKDCGQSEGTEGLSYMKNADGTGYILTGIGMATENEIIVHSVYKDLPVVDIADSAFFANRLITKITIPNSVANIGSGVFENCDSLTKINYLGTIDEWVQISFSGSILPSSTAKLYINDELITNANITTATRISSGAFSFCDSLISITIPNSVTSIDERAFYNCSSLTSVTIGNGVTNIGNYAFRDCSSLTSIKIPNSVTNIGYSAFYNCSSLTSIEIPNNVTSIGNYTFYNCSSLTSIEIPNSVTNIGYSAFYNCSSLTSVTIGNGDIGERAFYNCSSLTSVTINNGVANIGSGVFENCDSLTKINYLGTIDEWVQISFSGSILPSSTAKLYINDELITNANITTATRISSYAFSFCDSLTSITIPNSVTSIGNAAFYNCSSLTSIEIPNSVTSIGNSAFYNCSSLTSIEIPNSVTNIGYSAFEGCDSLTNVYYKGTAQEWNNISISGFNSHLKSATRYYYIENQEDLPNDNGNYWHYVDGVPTVWTKTEN